MPSKRNINQYSEVSKAGMTPREVEATVLTKAAARLKKCRDNWDPENNFKELDEALRYNQRIWSIFQAELVKEDSPLPRQLREDMLNLSIYVDKRIIDIMAYPEQKKLDVLININKNIAAGLRGTT